MLSHRGLVFFFLNERHKGVDPVGRGGREKGGVNGGGTIIKIYCMSEESILNKR